MTVSLRVLVAVHGYEPSDWVRETGRLVATWTAPLVRVLATLDVPCPPFTALAPAARRAYGAARMHWTAIERSRLQNAVETLRPVLPAQVDVVEMPAMGGDLARTIAGHARTWAADVLIVGAPPPGLRSWLKPGPVHERVVRLATCSVVVATSRRPVGGAQRRVAAVLHPALAEHRA